MKKNQIKILPQEIANKIAAGEVVQRPLSVIKELVENAIDAQATQIIVKLKNSGLDEISVEDNGIGMDEENVKLCLAPHATSKIKTEEDIYKIVTLGFRGEALASISAVSKFELITSQDGINGYKLIKNGDEPQEIKKYPSNIGTTIRVKNLFFNTPARYKHLSSTFYELSIIMQYLNKAALNNPNIKFEIYNNENLLFKTIGDNKIENIFQKIYSKEIAQNIKFVHNQNEHFKMDAYLVKPEYTRSRKNHMHISVNDRIIKNIAIEKMILKGYGKLLHNNQFPIVFISIHTDYSLIDINIHPTKEQIKISLIDELENLIIPTIFEKIREEEFIAHPKITKDVSYEKPQNKIIENQTLENTELEELDNLFKSSESKTDVKPIKKLVQEKSNTTNEKNNIEQNTIKKNGENNRNKIDENNKIDKLEELNSKVNKKTENIKIEINEDSSKYITNNINEKEKSSVSEINTNTKNDEKKLEDDNKINIREYQKKEILDLNLDEASEKVTNSKILIPNAHFVGIHQKTYLLFENETGIFLVDQHAAQERIRYEMYYQKFVEKKYNFQRVLIPILFEYTESEFLLVEEKLPEFAKIGLIFEKFGPNVLRLIEADSMYLAAKDAKKDIEFIISKIVKEEKVTLASHFDLFAATMACKSSIKAHDYLVSSEALKLMEELGKCKEPYTCPHGRPIIVNLTNYEIEKMFKRIV